MVYDDNYFTIRAWMTKKLGLRGVNRDVFAVIYGFTQDRKSWWSGSLNWIAELTDHTKKAVIESLKYLEIKGFIFCERSEINGVSNENKYQCNFNVIDRELSGVEGTLGVVSREHYSSIEGTLPPSVDRTPLNNKDNKEKNKDNNKEMEPEVPTHSKMERYKNREVLSDDLHSAEEMEEKSIKKKTGRKYNQDEVEEEILNYTDNVELQDALRDYVATIRHPSMGKYRLKGAPQFRSYLKQLSACIKNVDDIKEILEIVRYSTQHSYPQFYPLSDRDKGNYDRRDPNIVVTPAMTREEKEAEIARRKKRWEERHGEQTSV